ncbi:MAG: TolC family protein [Prevotella sp.]
MKRAFFSIAIIVSAITASAETRQWTLRQCIDYALEHNITVKQQQNATESQRIQLDDNRGNHLPTVEASMGQNFSFGRGLTAQNTYENTNTSNTSFSLNASVPIFAGNKIVNAVKLAQLNLDASLADLEKAKDDIRTQVAKAYVQILYDYEVSEVAQRQIAIDSMQVYRLERMLEAGKASPAEVSQQRATLAQSRLTATNADNNYRLSLLALSQLLELPTPEGFDIAHPFTDAIMPLTDNNGSAALPSPDLVYAEALGIKPQVKAEELRLSGSEYNIKIARGDYFPTLSFSAGLGTNYYTTSGFDADSFGKQLKNNFSQYLGINLSIPIFNHFSTRNKIRTAKIDRENQALRLENTKKDLYKEIQQVYYNAVASSSRYASSEEAVRSNEDAFQLTRAKYENGKATITEFNEQKNNLLKAQSDMVQAKYEYLYQTSLLDFYRGKTLEF